MGKTAEKEPQAIFVDCFNTVILRNKKNSEIFRQWAQSISTEFGLDKNMFYRAYRKLNWKMSAKKLFTQFVLQADFDDVIGEIYQKIYHADADAEFLRTARQKYSDAESEAHFIQPQFIEFLRTQKQNGKKIYVVSDFYCSGDVIKQWLENLGILDIFDGVFSSTDFNREKSTLKLYKYLLKKLDLKPADVVMYGDNGWSDVFMPKLLGIKSQKINHKKGNYAKEKRDSI